MFDDDLLKKIARDAGISDEAFKRSEQESFDDFMKDITKDEVNKFVKEMTVGAEADFRFRFNLSFCMSILLGMRDLEEELRTILNGGKITESTIFPVKVINSFRRNFTASAAAASKQLCDVVESRLRKETEGVKSPDGKHFIDIIKEDRPDFFTEKVHLACYNAFKPLETAIINMQKTYSKANKKGEAGESRQNEGSTVPPTKQDDGAKESAGCDPKQGN